MRQSGTRIKRSALILAAVSGMVLGLSGGVSAKPVAPAFEPPASGSILTRTLRRPLPGGETIVSRRSYLLQVAPEAGGHLINGRLVSSEVEAPDALAELAEVERSRSDTTLFPLQLDSAGRIITGDLAGSGDSLRKAVEIVGAQLGKSRLAALDMLQAQAFVQQLRSRPASSQWPSDLFRPEPGRRTVQRLIPLPNGVRGHVTLTTDASTRSSGGLLDRFTRTVTTDLDGDMRVTHEEWTLSPGS